MHKQFLFDRFLACPTGHYGENLMDKQEHHEAASIARLAYQDKHHATINDSLAQTVGSKIDEKAILVDLFTIYQFNGCSNTIYRPAAS
jgi:hypothetical protein